MEKALRCIVVDDEPKAVSLMLNLVSSIHGMEVAGSYTNSNEALAGIMMLKPDVLFVDIQMPLKNGLDLARNVFENGLHPYCVFTTGYDQYAIEAIKNNAFDYLLKPVDRNDLLAVQARILGQINLEPNSPQNPGGFQKFRFNTLHGFVLINVYDIVYIKANGNYSELHLSNGESKIVTLKLIEIEKMELPTSLIRTGRSYIINTDYLTQVDRKNGSCILKYNDIVASVPINRNGIKLLTDIYDN